jgi:uncharacterized protein YbaR (Trm112 family)
MERLDDWLVAILACPADRGPLMYFPDDGWLYNPRLARRYRIEDGIPIMLVEEAEQLDEAGHEVIMARARELGIGLNFTESDSGDDAGVE